MKTTRIARLYSLTKDRLALAGLGLAFTAGAFMLHTDFPVDALAVPLAAHAQAQPLMAARQTVETPSPQSAQADEQRALAEFISKRWRIADSAASRFVAIAYTAGQRHSVDPILILAVMAIESAYNPIAESVVGAKGLMQVIPKFHLEKLVAYQGEDALLDPEVNIHVGAQILREYYRRLKDLPLALQMYGGAFDEPTLQYSSKVLAERARLEPVRERARRQSEQSV